MTTPPDPAAPVSEPELRWEAVTGLEARVDQLAAELAVTRAAIVCLAVGCLLLGAAVLLLNRHIAAAGGEAGE